MIQKLLLRMTFIPETISPATDQAPSLPFDTPVHAMTWGTKMERCSHLTPPFLFIREGGNVISTRQPKSSMLYVLLSSETWPVWMKL